MSIKTYQVKESTTIPDFVFAHPVIILQGRTDNVLLSGNLPQGIEGQEIEIWGGSRRVRIRHGGNIVLQDQQEVTLKTRCNIKFRYMNDTWCEISRTT